MGLTAKQRELKRKRVIHKLLGEPIEVGDVVMVRYYEGTQWVKCVVKEKNGEVYLVEPMPNADIGQNRFIRCVMFDKTELRKVFQ